MIGFVLQNTCALAADHPIALLPFQHQAKDGKLGQKGFDPGNDFPIARFIQHPLGKAGAVKIIHIQNPLPDQLSAFGTGIHRQVAAFGVTRQMHGCRRERGIALYILLSQPLGGNAAPEGHVEVLFPAHQGAVGTPERQQRCSIVQQKCHRRKLDLLLGIKDTAVKGEAYLAESVAFRGCLQQRQILFMAAAALGIRLRHEHFIHCLQGDHHIQILGQDPIITDIR